MKEEVLRSALGRSAAQSFAHFRDYPCGVKAYYEARAREYDDWVYGTGLFAGRDRPDWHAERERLQDALAALPPARTLDVACGTGWMTQPSAG